MTGTYKQNEDVAEIYDVGSLGEGLSLTSRKAVELTPERAAEYLDKSLEFTDVDRPLKPRHVEYLATAMIRNTFRSQWVTIMLCRCRESFGSHPAGSIYRMNGQHTCWARISAEDMKTPNQKIRCPVHEEMWTAKTVWDMRQLYASIDRNSPRTSGNIVMAYLGGSEQYGEFDRKTIKLLASALKHHLWDTTYERGKYDADAVSYLMETDYLDLCTMVGKWIKQCGSKQASEHIRRAPVVSAMYATFEKSQAKSKEFWHAVVSGVGMTQARDPRLKLRTELLRTTLRPSGNSNQKVAASEDMRNWCIQAWNAWRKGKQLSNLRAGDSRYKPL